MIRKLTGVAATAILLFAGCSSGPQAGPEAAAFAAIYNDGENTSLASLKGSVVILDFWAVW